MKITILYSHRLLGQPKDIFTVEIMNATFCFYEQKNQRPFYLSLELVFKRNN